MARAMPPLTRMGTELIQVRANPTGDPDGSRMERFLEAHIALERAVSRRVAIVHFVAFLALPMWLCAEVPAFHAALPPALWLLGGALAVLAVALYDERFQRVEARRARRGVDARRIAPTE